MTDARTGCGEGARLRFHLLVSGWVGATPIRPARSWKEIICLAMEAPMWVENV